jgi:hypothetical protein
MYEMVSIGDRVELVGQRNEETAKLFGEPLNPAVAEPLEVAGAGSAAASNTTVAIASMPTDASAEGVAVTGNW